MQRILVVDDEPHVLSALKRQLRGGRFALDVSDSPVKALKMCDQHNYPLVIADQKMPVMLGTELLGCVKAKLPHSTRIILSGFSDFDAIVKAFNHGVIHQFVPKPWDNQYLLALIDAALTTETAKSEAEGRREIGQISGGLSRFHDLYTGDESMLELFKKIERAARSEAPVFIFGETGTGKELVARALHREGTRRDKHFIGVSCANFSQELMESQLFGHRKGAFTGAISNQDGLFAQADQGTLFMDEVTSLPLDLQSKLLRVVQEREFTPLGSAALQKFDVQLVSASNQHLVEAVANGTFREDLYYRLCVIPLALPPLRERGLDIERLCSLFFSTLNKEKVYSIEEDVLRLFRQYSWPGNIRQLFNVCQYIVAMSQSNKIGLSDLPEDILQEVGSECSENVQQTEAVLERAEVTQEEILDLLKRNDNNRTLVAQKLGISRMTLWRRMKLFGIE